VAGGGDARKGTTMRSGVREKGHPFYKCDRMVEWDSASSRRHMRHREGEGPGAACVGGGRGVRDRRGRAWRGREPQGQWLVQRVASEGAGLVAWVGEGPRRRDNRCATCRCGSGGAALCGALELRRTRRRPECFD
jgi:hypothetical protein